MFRKYCPDCGDIQTYSSKYKLGRAIGSNTRCRKCAGRKDACHTKKCTKCNEVKNVSEFYERKSDGQTKYRASCKMCMSIAYKNTYPNRKDAIRKTQQRYKADGHRAKVSGRYRAKHRDIIVEKQRQRRRERPEKERQYAKRWRNRHPERSRAIVRRKRERRKNIDSNIDTRLEARVYKKFRGKCFNCGSTYRLEIDHHHPVVMGNSLSDTNAVLLCKSCNCRKGAKRPEDFYSTAKLRRLEKLGIK